MSLENSHKIAKKDGHLHETAKKDHRLWSFCVNTRLLEWA